MKKLFIILLLGLFLISFTSAVMINYDKGENGNPDLKVNLKNNFLFFPTTDIGTVELKSHPSVNYIKEVGAGKQVVMYYDFSFRELYKNGLGEVTFIDMKNGKEVERAYKYVYWGNESYESPVFTKKLTSNGTMGDVQTGTETLVRERWLPYNSKNIPKENIRIGIEVEVLNNDYIDGVWEIAGQKVQKHATWTESLTAGLVGYYSLNETTGNYTNSAPGYSGSGFSAYEVGLDRRNDAGAFLTSNFSGHFDGSAQVVNTNTTYLNATGGIANNPLTSCLWFNATDVSGEEMLVWKVGVASSGNPLFELLKTGNQIRIRSGRAAGTTSLTPVQTISANTWVFTCGISNVTGLYLYINGTLAGSVANSNEVLGSELGYMSIGTGNYTSAAFGEYTGQIDEIMFWNRSLTTTEITNLFNSYNPATREGGLTFWDQEVVGLDISLISPQNNSGFSTNNVNLVANVSNSEDISTENVSLLINGIINQTNTSGFGGLYNFSSSLSDGDYNWSVIAFGNDSAQYNATNGTLYFSVDTTPPSVNITSPTGTFNYLYSGYNLTLNFTATENNALSTCWYEYNNTNTTISCTNATLKTVYFDYARDKNSIRVWANDSVGGLGSSSTSWDYTALENSITYTNSTLETSTQNFILNIKTKDSSIPTSSLLNYDGTNYNSTVGFTSGNYTLSNTIQLPNISASENKTFNFSFSVNGTAVTSRNFNQTVVNINFTSCTLPSPTNLVYNFTTYDSENQTRINASFEANFQFYAGTGETQEVYNFDSIDQNVSNWLFCMDSSGINVSANAIISYYADGYDRREYIIDNQTIYSNLSQNISLYLGATADTDVVTITVTDQNYNPLQAAIVSIQEWNIGTNTYSTIGMLTTNSEGQGIINLELYNVWYRAIIYYNGSIVEVTEPQKLAAVTWPIIVTLSSSNPYSLFGSVSHGLEFDNVTNITTYTWMDVDENVQTGCLIVKNLTSLGYSTISSECTSSSSGIVNYQLVGNGDYEITGILYLIPIYNVSSVTDVLLVRLGVPTNTAVVSPFGKVLSFLLIGTLGAIGISTGVPILAAILLFLGVFISKLLGWLNITESILWGIAVVIVIILFRIFKK